MYPLMQYVGEFLIEELTLHAYFDEKMKISTLYEDAGDGYEYKDGVYNEKIFQLSGSKEAFNLSQSSAHKGYTTSYKVYIVIIHGLPFKPKECFVDGVTIPITKNGSLWEMKVPENFEQIFVRK